MRRLAVLSALVVALAAAVPAASAQRVFLVDGRGWGHGIGMAQYGAQGFASKDGRSYAWILAHYYRGTALGTTSVDQVRVLLADGRGSLAVGSAAAFSATDASGRTFTFRSGALRLGPGLAVTVDGSERRLASPVTFSRGARPLTLDGRPYRGRLVVRSSGAALSAVNHVGLQEYLYGVVPHEMPPSWHAEALKAQAVAARSYAVVSRRTGGTFDLYADTRSQVYGGLGAEDARTNAAIDATGRRVVTYGGRVAHTFYHSTSGGRTAAIHHVWNAQPLPYLVSRADPHDNLSPYHRWGPLRYTGRELAARLGVRGATGDLTDVRIGRNPSHRAQTVAARGPRGTAQLAGTTAQARLALRSSWFSITVLSLAGDSRVTYGESAVLRGLVRGPRAAFLERRKHGGRWERARALARAGDGSFRLAVKPAITTSYRIATPKGRSPVRTVSVAPRVTFTQGAGNALAGRVQPHRAGARIVLQRRQGDRWVVVARGQTDAAGRFRVGADVRPGTYRALAHLGAGYVAGATRPLRVVAG